MLQVRLRLAPVTRPTQAERPHSLRDRPLDPRPPRVQPPAFLAADEGPHRTQRLVRPPQRQPQGAALLLRPGTTRPHRAIPAVRIAEADRHARRPARLGVPPPARAEVALGAPHLL